MKKLVFFASGSGSNFQSVIDAIKNNELPATISGLISDQSDAGSLERARKNGIPTSIIPFSTDDRFSLEIEKQLEKWDPDLIILAGYLRKIPDSVIESYKDQIINIHPSLLPKYGGKGFYGLNVHRAVIEAGDTRSGCTVHFVNNEYDRGSIIQQTEVPVYSDDTPKTLAERVLRKEHKLLPSVINQLIQ